MQHLDTRGNKLTPNWQRPARLGLLALVANLSPCRAAAAVVTRTVPQVYNPADYLRTRIAIKNTGAPLAPAANAERGPSLMQLTGVECSGDAAPAPLKSCAPSDPNCVSLWQRNVAGGGDKGSRTALPNGAEIAEQIFDFLKENCHSAGTEHKTGFAPAVEVSVAQPGTDLGSAVRKRQVSASLGINGSF